MSGTICIPALVTLDLRGLAPPDQTRTSCTPSVRALAMTMLARTLPLAAAAPLSAEKARFHTTESHRQAFLHPVRSPCQERGLWKSGRYPLKAPLELTTVSKQPIRPRGAALCI
jgi:hypothetical protein